MEQQLFIFSLINRLVEKHCYVKKYFEKFRVMDMWHNPQVNISAWQFRFLLKQKIIERKDDVWVVAVESNPYLYAGDIELKEKNTNNAKQTNDSSD